MTQLYTHDIIYSKHIFFCIFISKISTVQKINAFISQSKKSRVFTNTCRCIYYIIGDIFPIQLIVTSRLSKEHNFWLKNLTDNLSDTAAVRELAREYQDKQKNILYRSVMNVIIKANEELFKKECSVCEAIIDLFRDEYDEGIAKAKEEGIQQGIQENIILLFLKGLLSKENAAEELGVSVEEFEKMVKKDEATQIQDA